MDNRTEQLADGVWRVEVLTYVNTYVLANDGVGDDEGLTIVDTGTKQAGPRLVRSVRMLGFDARAIDGVLLTHWHGDHTGSAARFASAGARPKIWVGRNDLAVVRGERRPEVPPPPDTTALGRAFARIGNVGPPVPSAQGLDHGDRHEAAGGVEVVDTPGHTVGSVSYLLPSRGVLIAGDALANLGRLSQGPRFLCTALSKQQATARQIADLGWDTVAVGHGPAVTQGARRRVEQLAAG